jgi:hypothetical protein
LFNRDLMYNSEADFIGTGRQRVNSVNCSELNVEVNTGDE